MMLALWFVAAFAFAFVVGHSKISLVLRELLAGIPASTITVTVPYTIEAQGVQVNTVQTQPAIPPMFGAVGPWIAALMECVACLGWWLGALAGASGFISLPVAMPLWQAGFFLAFATCGVNLLLAKWVGLV